MKLPLLLLALLPAPATAEVILACHFDGLPQVVMRYPDGVGEKPTMSVDGRPPVEMTVGNGTMRFESAVVDGYNFRFSPAAMNMDVEKGAESLVNGAPGSCITIGGPVNEVPLALEPTAAAAKQDAPAPAAAPEDVGAWRISETSSAFDDSATVMLSLDADMPIAGQYGRTVLPTLVLRCKENTTSVFFDMGDYFLADIQGYGRIDTRVDKAKTVVIRADASTSNHALGLWSGAQAIPFIKRIAAGAHLAVRITPYNESPKEISFTLAGLDAALPKLRGACKW
ncbi:MAG: type VI secretion system-associated protein TagO [Paenirhodobacter sp.]|uniref:type VI secretion system-associated protein TagO n=1 Tax=Paenirhodobacter sp. TaxID=1965326 RepID=UPI003D0F351A